MELERWPVVSGSFRTGNPEDPVALVILGAEEFEDYQGCAIYGSVKTENLGLEKMVANTVSNPNIRYFLLAGEEVKGHRTGNSLKALLENGLDESGRIIGAEGAIPYIENIPREAVERFREQITLIDMVGTTDRETLQQKIFELQRQNPGPLDKPPLVFEKKAKKKKKPPAFQTPEVPAQVQDFKASLLLLRHLEARVRFTNTKKQEFLRFFALGSLLGLAGVFFLLFLRGLF